MLAKVFRVAGPSDTEQILAARRALQPQEHVLCRQESGRSAYFGKSVAVQLRFACQAYLDRLVIIPLFYHQLDRLVEQGSMKHRIVVCLD